MRISSFFYTLRQGVRNLFRNKWFTLASIATISACLFLFGLFYAIVINFQHIVKTAEDRGDKDSGDRGYDRQTAGGV